MLPMMHSACFLSSRATCPGAALLTVAWILPRQGLTKSAPQTCLQSSSMEGFSHVRPLFSDDLSLCQVDKKEPNTHNHLETDARSVSWREDDSLLLLLLLLSSFCGHVLCVAASEERAGPLPRHRGCSKCLRPSMVLSFLCFKGTSNSLSA